MHSPAASLSDNFSNTTTCPPLICGIIVAGEVSPTLRAVDHQTALHRGTDRFVSTEPIIMRLDTSQQMRTEMRLRMAPRMIQSMEILQLPVMALQERIEQELSDNAPLADLWD